MPTFTTSSLNGRSPAETFAFIVDLSRWPMFRGYGPLPGIVEATLEQGPWGPGARVRVRNTDGSVHHEVVRTWEPVRRYAIVMELVPPASHLMAAIEEEVVLRPEDGGTRVLRTFRTVPRGWWTAPMVWLLTRFFLRPAVEAHDRAVAAALGSAKGRRGA